MRPLVLLKTISTLCFNLFFVLAVILLLLFTERTGWFAWLTPQVLFSIVIAVVVSNVVIFLHTKTDIMDKEKGSIPMLFIFVNTFASCIFLLGLIAIVVFSVFGVFLFFGTPHELKPIFVVYAGIVSYVSLVVSRKAHNKLVRDFKEQELQPDELYS